MKKYLIGLFLTVLVSISFLSCDFDFYGDENPSVISVGFDYKFTSEFLVVSTTKYKEPCEISLIAESPTLNQYTWSEVDYPYILCFDSLNEGGTLTIYAYYGEFEYDNQKEFNREDPQYLIDTLVFIGPTEIIEYWVNRDSASFREVESLCP